MGWARMLLHGNWGQQMDIEDQKQEIEALKKQLDANSGPRETYTLQARIAELETDNSELRLYMAALIRYLGHKGTLHQDEFQTLVKAIDVEDGSQDRGYTGKIMK